MGPCPHLGVAVDQHDHDCLYGRGAAVRDARQLCQQCNTLQQLGHIPTAPQLTLKLLQHAKRKAARCGGGAATAAVGIGTNAAVRLAAQGLAAADCGGGLTAAGRVGSWH